MSRVKRKSSKNIVSFVLRYLYFQVAFFVLMSSYSYAYIDPSAVTYMIQAVAAVAIAGGAALTVLRHRIASLFRKNTHKAVHRQIVFSEEPAPYDADFADRREGK